jgi:hypothetical protein
MTDGARQYPGWIESMMATSFPEVDTVRGWSLRTGVTPLPRAGMPGSEICRSNVYETEKILNCPSFDYVCKFVIWSHRLSSFRSLVSSLDGFTFVGYPGPHRRISHSSICKADERRLHELDPSTDFSRVGNSDVYFYGA